MSLLQKVVDAVENGDDPVVATAQGLAQVARDLDAVASALEGWMPGAFREMIEAAGASAREAAQEIAAATGLTL